MLDWRWWPTIRMLIVLLLIVASVVVTNTFRFRRDKKRFLGVVAQQNKQLEQAQSQLKEAKGRLANAEKKLGFINQHKTKVEVTAFTVQGTFANGHKTEQAYAVPSHRLPENSVLNIALSPSARERLHARLNDYIVLLDQYQQKIRLAQFVDMTSADELRPVIDVFFADPEEARIFGRQIFHAVNISADGSPFSEN